MFCQVRLSQLHPGAVPNSCLHVLSTRQLPDLHLPLLICTLITVCDMEGYMTLFLSVCEMVVGYLKLSFPS